MLGRIYSLVAAQTSLAYHSFSSRRFNQALHVCIESRKVSDVASSSWIRGIRDELFIRSMSFRHCCWDAFTRTRKPLTRVCRAILYQPEIALSHSLPPKAPVGLARNDHAQRSLSRWSEDVATNLLRITGYGSGMMSSSFYR